MLLTGLDLLTSHLRRGDKSFPKDVASLIYQYLPTYKMVDFIVQRVFESFIKSNSLHWLNPSLLKPVPEQILNTIDTCLGRDFDTFMYRYFTIEDLAQRFDNELSKILPFYRSDCDYENFDEDTDDENKIPFVVIYCNYLLHEKYGKIKNKWALNSFRDDIFPWTDDVGKSIYDGKVSGYHTKFERFFEGEKTIAEAIDFFMTDFVDVISRY